MKLFPANPSRSLRIKFGLLVLLLLFIIFSLSSGVLIYRSIDTQRKNLISQARSFAKLSAKPVGSTYSLYYNSGYLKFKELVSEVLALDPEIEKVQIISVSGETLGGEVLFDSEELISGKPTKREKVVDKLILDKVNSNVGAEIPEKSKTSIPEEIIEPYFEDFGAHPFSIRYFISYDTISQNVFSTVLATVFLSTFFFAVSILLIIWVVDRTILNPIETVIQGARKISMGNLSHTIEVKTKDEVEDLAFAVNQMAQTLRKNIEDLKELDKLKDEFVFLASHNLRTPLTVIKGYIEIIQQDKTLGEDILSQIKKISTSTKELEEITETLLSLVSLEKGEEKFEKVAVDIGDMIKRICEGLNKKMTEKRVTFTFELPTEPLPRIKIDKNRIIQAFTGLIDNAIKFNKEGGQVVIKIEKKTKEVLVSIQDTGIGISKEEVGNIFKKFHRATDVLTYNYVGIGLGLYLTKLIIEAHRGKIWFESEAGKGTTFYVSFPV